MTEYQITSWREIPSLVIARSGETVIKISLPPIYQEAIDEAAMRLGSTDSDAYLAGWLRGPWMGREGTPEEVATSVSDELMAEFTEMRLTEILNSLSEESTK